jgi:chaperonin GroEL
MYREIAKSKTAAKTITYGDHSLKKIVLDTVKKVSTLVGSTLGPNGKVVLIERQENLEPFTSKDGITVFNSMAFADPTAQAVLEAARSSSSKTNSEAGDSTTSSAILAESLIRLGFEYIEKNPQLSVQKIMREMEKTYKDMIIPFIQASSVKINDANSNDLLKKVAMIATNSDDEMSDAVMEAFDLVGHNGNITIDEVSGTQGFKVEKIEGLPISRGLEDSCGRFLEEFINDKGNYRTVLEKPRFILYHGKLNDISPLLPILNKIVDETGLMDPSGNQKSSTSPNIVVVAHHFSETVLAFMANNFKNPGTLNIFPLKTPMTQQTNSQYHFLVDLQAFTGAELFSPEMNPLENAEIEHLGIPTMNFFECYRYRSLILGEPDEMLVLTRVEDLLQQSKQAESSLDQELLNERSALLTGGVARVKVLGSSESELKEKKHRVEDAVMAIKGAIKDGVLPGCAKTLLTLAYGISKNPNTSDSVKAIMCKAFAEPFNRILTNGGAHKEEISDIYNRMMSSDSFFHTYDALNHRFGDAIELGVIDSALAISVSIKNSLSVAKMLMGLSGIIVFQRDFAIEAGDAKSYAAEHAAIAEALKENEKEKWEVPI